MPDAFLTAVSLPAVADAIESTDDQQPRVGKTPRAIRAMLAQSAQRGKSRVHHRHKLWIRNVFACDALSHLHVDVISSLEWLLDSGVVMHPSLRCVAPASLPLTSPATAAPSRVAAVQQHRDTAFIVECGVRKGTILATVPRKLWIGHCAIDMTESLGEEDDKTPDICKYFFKCVEKNVDCLLGSYNSSLTDVTHGYAKGLYRTRTLTNAPYLKNVFFTANPKEPTLADVLLQMIQGFVERGPLSGKVELEELQWAVSVCLSHTTPMSAPGQQDTIGIIPLVSMFPHAGGSINAVLAPLPEGCVSIVASQDIAGGEEVRLQAMIPQSTEDEESTHMWVLCTGTAPTEFTNTSVVNDRARSMYNFVKSVHGLR